MTRQGSLAGSMLELLAIVVGAVGIAFLVQAFVVKPYRIPSGSMLPTLRVGQRILVNRSGVLDRLRLGEIVVFHPPVDPDACADPDQGQPGAGPDLQACDVAQARDSATTFVKRLVGLPGDRLQIRGGHVVRNGRPEADSFTIACHRDADCNFPGTIVVPRGDYYMMGDNRPDSEDSRFWGPVRRNWIVGPAFFTYWPLSRVGGL